VLPQCGEIERWESASRRGFYLWGSFSPAIVSGFARLEANLGAKRRQSMKKQNHAAQIKRLLLSRETLRRLDLEMDGFLNREVAGGSGSLCEDTCITSRHPACPAIA
jgi:hypothetical protein